MKNKQNFNERLSTANKNGKEDKIKIRFEQFS